MKIYKNANAIKEIIIATSNYYKVTPAIIEKDYFVTVILSKLVEEIPGLLFKGGTCLSKCFGVINRFSEDLDLTLDSTHFTYSNKINANRKIIDVCDQLSLVIENREQVENHSHGNYNCYIVRYPKLFNDYAINPFIKIEMVFFQKSYPDLMRPVNCMIKDYLITIKKRNLLVDFELDEFQIRTQSLERTFVDKVFALCDYYLNGNYNRQSRHIYDIKCLQKVIDWKNLKELISEVRKDRAKNRNCLSAQAEIDVSAILGKIVTEEYFKKDYEEVTELILIKDMKYEEAIQSIINVVREKIF